MKPYEHDHSGVLDLSWDRFGLLAKGLTERIRRDYDPEVVVGIAKGGVIPAVVIASACSVDFFPIKLSRRADERVVRDDPEILVPPTAHLSGRRVLLVDDISVTGRTMEAARERIVEEGPADVRSATLVVHGASVKPEWYALETDALIRMPWDRDILRHGEWTLNPEYEEPKPHQGD